MLEKILIFAVFLFPIIFFHELGHFIFARICGVRVEVFSIGFGPKLVKWKKWGTEYAISLIPLGGYVKMFGDDPLAKDKISEEERKYAFNHKGKWERFWVVFGGPLANFLLAFFLYFGLFVGGEKVPEIGFGALSSNSKFALMGIRSGDVLKKINGKTVASLVDISMDGEMIQKITVQRDSKEQVFAINEPFDKFMNDFFSASRFFRLPIMADRFGQKYGISLEAKVMDSTFSLDHMAERENIKEIHLFLASQKNGDLSEYSFDLRKAKSIKISYDSFRGFFVQMAKRGYYPLDMVVASIVGGSPADKAGFRKGDIIAGLGGEVVERFDFLKSKIQKIAPKGVLKIKLIREGKTQNHQIIPELKEDGKDKVYAIGVYSAGQFLPPKYVDRPSVGIFESIPLAFMRTLDAANKTLQGFFKLITNRVSVKNIGGPLAIGKVAADSFYVSLSYFFSIMALISINLGIINLFPIPVLDGGHIMFIILEMINRRPLSHRKMEIAQQIGISFLLGLIFLTLFNDISRLF